MLSLRSATTGDAQFLWECRNDDMALRFSGSTEAIPYAAHCRWLASRLRDPDCQIYLGVTADGTRVGYGRLDQRTISVAVHPVLRRLGFASQLIALTTQEAHSTGMIAWIRPENAASKRAFASCGYQYTVTESQNGQLVERWDFSP